MLNICNGQNRAAGGGAKGHVAQTQVLKGAQKFIGMI